MNPICKPGMDAGTNDDSRLPLARKIAIHTEIGNELIDYATGDTWRFPTHPDGEIRRGLGH